MAENSYVNIATTTNAPERAMPIVDPRLYRIRPARPIVSMFNGAIKSGSVESLGARRFQGFHQWPQLNQIVVTAAANAAATSLTIKGAGNASIYSIYIDPRTQQQINVSAQPSSPTATSISVDAITYAIPAGTRLTHAGWNVMPENWLRRIPVSRNAEYHYDATSARQMSVALTWQQKWRKQYGPQDLERVEEQGLDNIEDFWDATLAFSDYRDGTSDADYRTLGVYTAGLKYNRVIAPNSSASLNLLNQVLYEQGKYAADGMFKPEFFISQYLKGMMNNLGWNAGPGGTLRTDPSNASKYGGSEATFTSWLPGVGNVPFTVHPLLDTQKEWQSMIFCVNKSNFRFVRYGEDMLVGPSSALPNGAADIAGGAIQWQWTQFKGIQHKLPLASCCAITNVKGFTY